MVAANCARQHINVATFTTPGTQIPTVIGGNPNLLPETARTYTIGTVITPRWIPSLSATIDYFHTKIANQINSLSTQFIVDSCYTSANFNSAQCAAISPRSATGQLTQVSATTTNLGEVHTNGIDFDLNYLLRLGGGHSLSFSNELVDLVGYTEQLVPNGPFVNLKGRITPINTGLYPLAIP